MAQTTRGFPKEGSLASTTMENRDVAITQEDLQAFWKTQSYTCLMRRIWEDTWNLKRAILKSAKLPTALQGIEIDTDFTLLCRQFLLSQEVYQAHCQSLLDNPRSYMDGFHPLDLEMMIRENVKMRNVPVRVMLHLQIISKILVRMMVITIIEMVLI